MSELLAPGAAISPLVIDEAVRRALDEDLGRAGDITSAATLPAGARARAKLVARKAGTIAGLECARRAFLMLDEKIAFRARHRDGDQVAAGTLLAEIEGAAAPILSGRAHGAEFPRPALGRGHAHRRLCRQARQRQGARRLHAQDHAGPPRAGKIRGALRRRAQSPLRSR